MRTTTSQPVRGPHTFKLGETQLQQVGSVRFLPTHHPPSRSLEISILYSRSFRRQDAIEAAFRSSFPFERKVEVLFQRGFDRFDWNANPYGPMDTVVSPRRTRFDFGAGDAMRCRAVSTHKCAVPRRKKAPAGPVRACADRSTTSRPRWSRVLLKVSGEALQGNLGVGLDPAVLDSVTREVAAASQNGVQVAIVVGGGNFFRGQDAWLGLDRASADYMGMLATCMNALGLQSALERHGVDTRVQSAIEMQSVSEPYIRRRAIRHLEKGRVVIFAAGTGNPFFTTDTAAALRAAEIGAEALLKATKVDGVYDHDPKKREDARMHEKLSYRQVQLDRLQVMDATAFTLCEENQIPVVVFNLLQEGNILKAVMGQPLGTYVGDDGHRRKGFNAQERAADTSREGDPV